MRRLYCFFFFFSSRRRHTRYWRDWSSDVCSSDLGAERDDLDFFPFPEVDSSVGTEAVEAPIDGFMMAKRPKNADGAKKLLEYLGSAKAEETYLATDANDVAVHKDADTAK